MYINSLSVKLAIQWCKLDIEIIMLHCGSMFNQKVSVIRCLRFNIMLVSQRNCSTLCIVHPRSFVAVVI